jgi:hypothetical protein
VTRGQYGTTSRLRPPRRHPTDDEPRRTLSQSGTPRPSRDPSLGGQPVRRPLSPPNQRGSGRLSLERQEGGRRQSLVTAPSQTGATPGHALRIQTPCPVVLFLETRARVNRPTLNQPGRVRNTQAWPAKRSNLFACELHRAPDSGPAVGTALSERAIPNAS